MSALAQYVGADRLVLMVIPFVHQSHGNKFTRKYQNVKRNIRAGSVAQSQRCPKNESINTVDMLGGAVVCKPGECASMVRAIR